LKNLSGQYDFNWQFLPAIGTTGGILVGVRSEMLLMVNSVCKDFFVSCMV
jgi:hypothetical protein